MDSECDRDPKAIVNPDRDPSAIEFPSLPRCARNFLVKSEFHFLPNGRPVFSGYGNPLIIVNLMKNFRVAILHERVKIWAKPNIYVKCVFNHRRAEVPSPVAQREERNHMSPVRL